MLGEGARGLTLAVAAINAWNRLAIASRAEPGKYQAQARS
jgi:hypothetical protein